MYGQRIKKLRKDNGLTQEGLAYMTGLSSTAISAWEHEVNEPSLGALIKLANYFKVSIDYIVGRKG